MEQQHDMACLKAAPRNPLKKYFFMQPQNTLSKIIQFRRISITACLLPTNLIIVLFYTIANKCIGIWRQCARKLNQLRKMTAIFTEETKHIAQWLNKQRTIKHCMVNISSTCDWLACFTHILIYLLTYSSKTTWQCELTNTTVWRCLCADVFNHTAGTLQVGVTVAAGRASYRKHVKEYDLNNNLRAILYAYKDITSIYYNTKAASPGDTVRQHSYTTKQIIRYENDPHSWLTLAFIDRLILLSRINIYRWLIDDVTLFNHVLSI